MFPLWWSNNEFGEELRNEYKASMYYLCKTYSKDLKISFDDLYNIIIMVKHDMAKYRGYDVFYLDFVGFLDEDIINGRNFYFDEWYEYISIALQISIRENIKKYKIQKRLLYPVFIIKKLFYKIKKFIYKEK